MATAYRSRFRIQTKFKTSIDRVLEGLRAKSVRLNWARDASCASTGDRATRAAILRHTEATNANHLTPELKLHLITEKCPLWTAKADQCPFVDPYWAFYWPGGQALTRYILDNPETVRGRRVVDVGSGCGASAIGAAMRDATLSTANDIDEVAACAIGLNANANDMAVDISTSNVIGSNCDPWDTILVGDMFYDGDISEQITRWLQTLHSKGKTILIGDPGRFAFQNNQALTKELRLLKSYDLTTVCIQENQGLNTGRVWIWNGS